MSELPCFLCDNAEHYNIATLLITKCKIKNEEICDRNWVVPEQCWKYCPCATCPHNTGLKKKVESEGK